MDLTSLLMQVVAGAVGGAGTGAAAKNYSLGTVRYTHDLQAAARDPDMFESRDLALAHIEELRQAR